MNLNTLSGRTEVNNITGLKDLDISVASGSITISNLKLENLSVNATSGGVTLDNLIASKIEIFSQSGSLRTDSIKTEEFLANVTSGSVRLNKHKATKTELVVTSGIIYIKDNRDSIGFVINSISGSIRLYGERRKEVRDNLDQYAIKYRINVTSGSIKIEK